jgi:hypothetical protein
MKTSAERGFVMGKIKEFKYSPYLTIMKREARKRNQLLRSLRRGEKIIIDRDGVRSLGWFVERINDTSAKVVNHRGLLESVPILCISEAENGNRKTESECECETPSNQG